VPSKLRPSECFAVSRGGHGTEFAADAARKRVGDCAAGFETVQGHAADSRDGCSGGRGFEAMYAANRRSCAAWYGQETFEAIDMLRRLILANTRRNTERSIQPAGSDRISTDRPAFESQHRSRSTIRRLRRLDNHVNEGGVQGQLSNLLKDLGQGLAAFHQDLGDGCKTWWCTMSEFGRTAKENEPGYPTRSPIPFSFAVRPNSLMVTTTTSASGHPGPDETPRVPGPGL